MKVNTVPLLAEYLGTLLFVLSILASGGNPWFIGFSLAVVILFTSKMSGGNINPAVSVVMYLKGKLSMNELLGYVVSQVLGGVTSFYLFKALA
jgi:aquaporin Z